MTREEIQAQVDDILIKGFEVDPERLTPSALLGEDLELDSLDAVDLVVALEKRFGCRIEETEARAMRTLEDIYAYIVRRAGETAQGSGR